jgi:hypothetical protein
MYVDWLHQHVNRHAWEPKVPVRLRAAINAWGRHQAQRYNEQLVAQAVPEAEAAGYGGNDRFIEAALRLGLSERVVRAHWEKGRKKPHARVWLDDETLTRGAGAPKRKRTK